jgi:5-methylcytosine-specific restriction endonuclease McrA
MARSPGRTGHRWRQVRAVVLDLYDSCWLCGLAVDKDLDGRLPMGPSVDHVIPLKLGGDPLDVANLRLAHTACNSARENRSRAKTPGPIRSRRSRVW